MGPGPAVPVLGPVPPGALRDSVLDRAGRPVRRRPRAVAGRPGRRGLRRRQAGPQGRRDPRRLRHVHDLRRGHQRRRDELEALPARGSRRGLPAGAGRRRRTRSSPTTTSSCPPGRLADQLRAEQYRHFRGRRGSRSACPCPLRRRCDAQPQCGRGSAPRDGIEPSSLVLIQSQAGPASRPTGDRPNRLVERTVVTRGRRTRAAARPHPPGARWRRPPAVRRSRPRRG